MQEEARKKAAQALARKRGGWWGSFSHTLKESFQTAAAGVHSASFYVVLLSCWVCLLVFIWNKTQIQVSNVGAVSVSACLGLLTRLLRERIVTCQLAWVVGSSDGSLCVWMLLPDN